MLNLDRILKVVREHIKSRKDATISAGGHVPSWLQGDHAVSFCRLGESFENLPTDSEIVEYVTRYRSLLECSSPRFYLGMWLSGGKLYFDITFLIGDREAANLIGYSQDQMLIYDGYQDLCIEVDHSVVGTENSKDPSATESHGSETRNNSKKKSRARQNGSH